MDNVIDIATKIGQIAGELMQLDLALEKNVLSNKNVKYEIESSKEWRELSSIEQSLQKELNNKPTFKSISEQIQLVEDNKNILFADSYEKEVEESREIQKNMLLNQADKFEKYNMIQHKYNEYRNYLILNSENTKSRIVNGEIEESQVWKRNQILKINEIKKKFDSLKKEFEFKMNLKIEEHTGELNTKKSIQIDAINRHLSDKEIFDSLVLTHDFSKNKNFMFFQLGTWQYMNHKIRAVVPAFKNISFCYNEYNLHDVNKQIEFLILSLIQQINPKNIEITIIDFTIANNFKIVTGFGDALNISHINDLKTFEHKIEDLRKHAIRLNQDYLSVNGYSNIQDYNEFAEYPEPLNIIVLTDSWKHNKYFNAMTLNELITLGINYGIYFIFSIDNKWFESLQKKQEKQNYDFSQKDMLFIYKTIQKNSIVINKLPNGTTQINNIDNLPVSNCFKYFDFNFSTYSKTDIDNIRSKILQDSINSTQIKEPMLSVEIGKSGNQPTILELGDNNLCYNAFVAGSVGSGKSNFLQHLILSISEKYSPEYVRFLLMDYKEGLEFQVFKKLPHAELLMLDNQRLDLAKDVLTNFKKEKEIRAEMFKELSKNLEVNISNITNYNKYSTIRMPIKLLIIDEVHELFFGGWRQNREFQQEFQLIVKQGRAYGLYIIISTQNLEGFDLGEGIMEQIKLRVSFSLSKEQECRKILQPDNLVPLDLEEYQAVINSHYGRSDNKISGKKNNTIFKSAFAGDISDRVSKIEEVWKESSTVPKKIIEKSNLNPKEGLRSQPLQEASNQDKDGGDDWLE